MALDGIVIRALVNEMQALVGGRLHRIHQPRERDLLMQIRTKGKTHRLLLSANPTYPRMHFTNQTFENPLEPPMFCMLLRKHCENGRIESIEQIGFERMIRIIIRHKNELGDEVNRHLIVELMGRHSNIILMDEQGHIFDGIHHITPSISQYRVVMPGSQYVPPPEQHKQDPLLDREAWKVLWQQEDDEFNKEQRIVHTFSGISPLLAKEIVHRGFEELSRILDRIEQHDYEPHLVVTTHGKTHFSTMALSHLEGEHIPFESMHDCLEHFFGDKIKRDMIQQRTSDLRRLLQQEKNKNTRKLKKLEKTMIDAKEAETFRHWGELLTASLHQLKKGDSIASVIDYYDPEQATLEIQLDPLLTPAENAQAYFKKYTKAKNSLEVVNDQMEQTEKEILYFNEVLQQLANADVEDLEEIREELQREGYLRLRSKKKSANRKKSSKPQVTCYLSSEGIPIYVGKNNIQNEYVTNRLARSSDTWLHTKDIPGSHVVIRSGTFGDSTLEEAAMLAAYFSQARESSQVPVDYTEIRHVRKPNGAKPGYVIYDNQKTLFITPDEQRIKTLQQERREA